jgi:hypothetical protein
MYGANGRSDADQVSIFAVGAIVAASNAPFAVG